MLPEAMEFIRAISANISVGLELIPSLYPSTPWTEGLTLSARLRVPNKSVLSIDHFYDSILYSKIAI